MPETGMTPLMRRIERALAQLGPDVVDRADGRDWDEARAARVAQAVVACLRAEARPPAADDAAPGARLPRDALRRAVRFIHGNLESKLRWRDIAAAVGMGPFTFGRGFKVTTGMTPHQYVIRCRVRRAMKLLAGADRPIADIAFEVGCSCQSHLTTMFRTQVGTTPKVFRSAARRSRELLEAASAPHSPMRALPAAGAVQPAGATQPSAGAVRPASRPDAATAVASSAPG